jgi:hypothetical protein
MKECRKEQRKEDEGRKEGEGRRRNVGTTEGRKGCNVYNVTDGMERMEYGGRDIMDGGYAGREVLN